MIAVVVVVIAVVPSLLDGFDRFTHVKLAIAIASKLRSIDLAKIASSLYLSAIQLLYTMCVYRPSQLHVDCLA